MNFKRISTEFPYAKCQKNVKENEKNIGKFGDLVYNYNVPAGFADYEKYF
jgi:hypothetical protein